jgi:hypothetical protein
VSNICNPIAAAEIVGREYLESQMPSRDGYKTRKVFDNISLINQSVGSVEDSVAKVAKLHGPYRGPSTELVSFTKNLFGRDEGFRSSILEIENTVIGIQRIVKDVSELGDLIGDITLQDVSATLLRGYLKNVDILLPDGVRTAITSSLNKMPLFTEVSEALGTIYSNIIIPDNAINMVDGIIGNVLDSTGLSSVLGQHTWIRMLPEYAENFHDNIRLFQRLGSRVLPKCTYGKIFNIMDEPLAHLYNLAQDTFSFLDVLDNRKKYLGILFQQYGDLVKKINNLYPMCHEYSVSNEPLNISIGRETAFVDILGDKINKTENNASNNSKPPLSGGSSDTTNIIAAEKAWAKQLDAAIADLDTRLETPIT